MADLNIRMHLALRIGDLDQVKEYVAEGADPNSIYGQLQDTALAYVVTKGWANKKAFVKELLALGTDPNIPDKNGTTPLHLVAMGGWDCEVAELLLEAKANINTQTKFGMTALHLAVDEGMRLKKRELVNLLLERGADVSIKNSGGKTPLDVAEEHREIWDKEWMVALLSGRENKKRAELAAAEEAKLNDKLTQDRARLKAISRHKPIKICKPG